MFKKTLFSNASYDKFDESHDHIMPQSDSFLKSHLNDGNRLNPPNIAIHSLV